ncbi:MAG: A24 family peptidase [Paracoccaceae bacterium]
MAITAWSAIWFLPFVLPISIWAAWNDMKYMKIPNKAVVALTLVFLIVGLIAIPIAEYPSRLLHLVVVLAIGFSLNLIGGVGAGDAKFAAAMAPFIARGDMQILLYLFASVLLAAVVTHRLARRSRYLKNLAPDWESWSRKDFPMGLALGGTLVFYLIGGLFYGA